MAKTRPTANAVADPPEIRAANDRPPRPWLSPLLAFAGTWALTVAAKLPKWLFWPLAAVQHPAIPATLPKHTQ